MVIEEDVSYASEESRRSEEMAASPSTHHECPCRSQCDVCQQHTGAGKIHEVVPQVRMHAVHNVAVAQDIFMWISGKPKSREHLVQERKGYAVKVKVTHDPTQVRERNGEVRNHP